MFRFEDSTYLYLLLLIPVLIVIWFLTARNRSKRLRKFGDINLIRQLMPGVSKYRRTIKFSLLLAALALLIIMIARPQMGAKISHEKRTGIETLICLDISNSMKAEDVSPSRLMKSKMLIENLVDNFNTDKVGLIVFAGNAFVQLPITSDYVSAKMFLGNIEPGMIPTQGTNIAEALQIASASFTHQEGVGKAIIVITDGEDHEGGAVEAAKAAKDKGQRVYMLGIGSSKGSPIPDGQGGYMSDRGGQTVMSALNEDMCKQIASAGGGAYIHVDNTNRAQEQLNTELDKLSKKEMNSTIYSEYDEQFRAFGILALILLIIEICILDRKNPVVSRLSLFKRNKKTAMIVLLFILPSVAAVAQTDRQYIKQGNKLFREGKFAESEVLYRKALEKNGRNPQAVYNLGNALLMQKKDSAAIVQYQQASKMEPNKIRLAKSFHNMGVVCQSHQMYQEACTAYAEALRNNPKDDETRYNYVLCRRMMKNQGGGGGNDNKNDKNKDQNKDKKQDQNKDDKNKDQNKDQKKDQQKQQDQKDKMSKENAEQLLNAAVQQEQATQRRVKEAERKATKRTLEKNW